MKRVLAYIATGIVLGVAIMLIPPLMILPAYYRTFVGTLGTPDNSFLLIPTALRGAEEGAGSWGSKAEQAPALGGGITFLSSLLYVGLIFAVGLVSALGVYGLFRRRLMG